jgi:hypothetical protein
MQKRSKLFRYLAFNSGLCALFIFFKPAFFTFPISSPCADFTSDYGDTSILGIF